MLQHEWPLTLSQRVVLPVAIGRLDCFRYFHQDHLFEIVLAGHDLLLACRSLCRDQGRFRSSGDKLLQLLQDNQTDLNVVEGSRLIIARRKIKAASDRRPFIELAQRLAK